MSHHQRSERESHRERVRHYRAAFRAPVTDSGSARGASSRRARLFAIVVASALVAGGFFTLGSGAVGYHNYWGAPIFAPFAIAIGVLVLFGALFMWPRFSRTLTDKSGQRVVFPGSEWRKW